MATQINGTVTKNSNYWRYYIICSEQDIDIAGNTSKLKVDVYLGATSYSRAVRQASATHTVNVNGTNYTFTTGAYTIEKNTNVLLGSITSNAIAHDSDGSKKVTVTASSPDLAQASGYGPYSGSASGEVTLTTIPRTSSVTCADGNIGSATTINIVRASNTFTHTLKYSFGTLTGTIVTKTAEVSYGWTIPTTFYTQIPNASTGRGTITCETYSGDTLIGTSTCPFNAIVLEANNKPTITATIVDDNATTKALTGDANKLVKYFSNAKVTMTATAKNSATIKSQKVTCGDGKSSTSATSTLNGVESGTFNLTCTDSRGFVGTNTVTKTMVNYIKLAITSLTIARQSSTSNTINITLKGNYFNGSFGSVTNTLTLKWRYRVENGDWSGYTAITPTKSGNTFSYSGTLGTTFDYQQAYEFEVVAQDKLITETKTQPVTKGTPLVDIWKDNVKINGTNTATKFVGPLTGNASTSSQVYGTETNPTTATTYVVPFHPSVGTGNKDLRNNNGLYYRTLEGTESAEGYAMLQLGNSTASGTAKNKYGAVRIFSNSSGYATLRYTTTTGNTTHYLPSHSGNLQSCTNLYNNTSGTTGTVTLSETSANFTYLEIFYMNDDGEYRSEKIYSPNGKNAQLFTTEIRTTTEAIIKARDILINGTSITNSTQFEESRYGEINIRSNGNSLYANNKIYITRVDGYR